MIKRTFIIVFWAFTGLVSLNVVAASDVVPVKSEKIRTAGQHQGFDRSPMRLPIIYIEDHTLMFEDALIGQSVTILQDGQEVYSDVVGTDCTINLPESLNGEYELQMVIGDYIITGTFCVE